MTADKETFENAVRDYKNLCECLIEEGTQLHKKLKASSNEAADLLMPLIEKSLLMLTDVVENPLGKDLEDAASRMQPKSIPVEAATSSGQRKMPRFRKRYHLTFWEAKENKRRRGYSEDAGPTGLFIVTTYNGFNQGDKIWVQVTLPDKTTARCCGTLVWKAVVPASLRFIKRSGFGIHITSAPEQWYRLFM